MSLWATIVRPFQIPGVFPYSIGYACIKSVHYSLLFWLPFYLTQHLLFEDEFSALLSSMYDLGGIGGGILSTYTLWNILRSSVGAWTDYLLFKYKIDRSATLLGTCSSSAALLYVYYHFGGSSVWLNATLMAILGISIGSSATTIASTVSADLGSKVVRNLF